MVYPLNCSQDGRQTVAMLFDACLGLANIHYHLSRHLRDGNSSWREVTRREPRPCSYCLPTCCWQDLLPPLFLLRPSLLYAVAHWLDPATVPHVAAPDVLVLQIRVFFVILLPLCRRCSFSPGVFGILRRKS